MSESACFPDCASTNPDLKFSSVSFADVVKNEKKIPVFEDRGVQTVEARPPMKGETMFRNGNNKLAHMTRRQWSSSARALHVLLCSGCWKTFRDDETRLASNNGSQTIVIKVCDHCVRNNRTQRFD
ncbi:hypothetical protein PRIPAC_85390 [Pristionchus pacificus]|uniref:Uncharacterized protein n=1 Tax=Pristionchus pacificus TaxID=54126 RepID=A0A2A6BSA0_PRIPA|nr:hypothetical protein PRIPAC_85390 [Pristionchus pacificus]|eukprot:PDM68832.1 hypothetical protein PRIPAC_47134 [Pristionchus pacificus]